MNPIHTFPAATVAPAVEAARAALGATNAFQGLDADLDYAMSLLADELTGVAAKDLEVPREIVSALHFAVNYAIAQAWILHWPNRSRWASFNTEEEDRRDTLRRSQMVAAGAVLAAAAGALER